MENNIIYVMGVSGCGKSTIGISLAERLKRDFKDGDEFHSPENKHKMNSSIPLTDEDRYPWLETINTYAQNHNNCIIACSALKHKYRQILSKNLNAVFVLLQLDREVLHERVSNRPGHFMSPNLLDSQLNTLELPENEKNVIIVNANDSSVENVVNNILLKLKL